jgi:hypothetical protein
LGYVARECSSGKKNLSRPRTISNALLSNEKMDIRRKTFLGWLSARIEMARGGCASR